MSETNDLSFNPLIPRTNIRHNCLHKCFSCSHIHVLKSSLLKGNPNAIQRSVSLEDIKSSEKFRQLFELIDNSNETMSSQLKSFLNNPIIKITQTFKSIEGFDQNINNYDESYNSLRLSANHSDLSSISAEGGSSPTSAADLSPSDYFSHEMSESIEEVYDWDIDYNTFNCDNTRSHNAIDVTNEQQSLNYNHINQTTRSLRSNSSDSAILLALNDVDIEDNVLSLDSGSSQFNFRHNKSDKSFGIESTHRHEVWPKCLSNSHSCPLLEAPSVVISDHSSDSTTREENCEDIEDNPNVLALALESYFTQSSNNFLRRDSISSISSSCSSLSSLGEEDFVEEELQTSSCKLSPISAWRKVRSLVTSPFIQTYKKQKYPWIQLAGHQGNFLSGQTQGTILKKLNGTEEICFKIINNDVIKPLVPEYRKTIKISNEFYLELEDLLANFENPSIMDVKMGVRTYLEEELTKARIKPKLRKDMYEKMVAIDPIEPTDEENDLKAITKPRYMVWRETISSTASLGFRIEGVKQSNGKTLKDFKRTKSEEQVKTAFLKFIDNEHNYVIIGSSLLFVHDNKRADIWLIDFAKTYPLPNGIKISHQNEWQVGNHEDGYLIGLDSLIRIFNSI